MNNEAVRNSRAGDKFHYLWAARRCLKMIHPASLVRLITIEGSPESNEAGEYVIDVGEVMEGDGGSEWVKYYQLKHSTVRLSKPFTFSELENTIKGFADRFRAKPLKGKRPFTKREFLFISNRQVGGSIKNAFKEISHGDYSSSKVKAQLEKTTGLRGAALQEFCASMSFSDQEAGYIEQEKELRFEIAKFIAGKLSDTATQTLEGLVANEALPTPRGTRKRGTIVREQVLKSLGVDHPRNLFPAPLAMESLDQAFKREQHRELVNGIVSAPNHLILHAPGGVGKSIVAMQLAKAFSKGSVGLGRVDKYK